MKNKIKERMERILRGSILFTTLLTLAFPVQAWAKVGGNETEYTYTVTLCSGNQGYFSDTNGITVDNHITGSSYQIEKESQGEKIKISGLKYGDRVMVQAQSCIQLKEDGKYYPMMKARKGRESYVREIDYRFGKGLLEEKNQVLYQFLLKEQKSLETVKARLESANTKTAKARQKEIEIDLNYAKEALKEYEV